MNAREDTKTQKSGRGTSDDSSSGQQHSSKCQTCSMHPRMARDGHLGKEGGGEGIEVAISKESTDTETNKSGLWKVTDDYECYSRIHRERSIGTSNAKGFTMRLFVDERGEKCRSMLDS